MIRRKLQNMNYSFGQRSSFTPIELLIVTRLRKLHSLQRGKSALPTGRQVSSFTLIELLIVIGILAILTAAVVLVLNPSELLKQGRDSTRSTDLTSLQHAIYALETQVTPLSAGTASTVYISIPDTSTTCGNLGLPTLPAGYTYHCVTTANLKNINGAGWLPIDFTLSNIQQFASLPIDPINTTSSQLYYTYTPGGSYELTALMESEKGSLPAQSDNGLFPGVLEKGTHIGLTPPLRDRGLVGYWTFDEGTGTTAYDHSSNNNTGTLTNGPIWQTATNCKVGGCLSFDGVDDYVDCGSSLSVNGISNATTISAWVYLNSVSSPKTVISNSRDSSGSYKGYQLHIYTGGYPRFIIWRPDMIGVQINSPTTISPNVWNFLTATFDGINMKIYINGILAQQGLSNGLIGTPASYNLKIGTLAFPGGGWMFSGYLDDVRVYNRAFSATEILSLYNATK